MKRLPSVTVLLLAAAALAASVVVASADATVYVVHGIPGVAVDVAIDGSCEIENLTFRGRVGPIMLAPGSHQLTISMADAMNPCGGAPVLDLPVPFADGENVTLIAYLDGMCNPAAAKFNNDFSRTTPGMARLMLHHTACAPAMDIAVDRETDAPFSPDLEDFANGDQHVTEMRPGEWFVWLAEAGNPVPAVGPTRVKLRPFTVYQGFAVGSILDGSLTVLAFETSVKR